MDIQMNEPSQRFYLKRFTLSAIASAVFTFNISIAQASCPAQIVGTALANIVCDFDSGTGSSVTVNNGAIVGGITMNGYTPTSPSQIVINAGGTVSNSGGSAIAINSSSLSNGIENNGIVNSTTGTGITITASNISGGLTNNGLISTGSLGISINSSNVNGGILNSGTINSIGTGILINAASTITGDISNSGTIIAGGVDVGITITNNSTINGNIINSGLIEASGSGDGILIRSSSLNGGISNSGSIQSAGHTGIDILNGSIVLGDIINNGSISGDLQGLSIHNASIVNGNISNNGTMNGTNGNGLSIFSATVINGNISNSGTISGGNTGISVTSSSTINGSISNSGTIQGNINAIHVSSESTVNDINILGQSARIIGAVDAPNSTVNITSGAIFTSEGTFNVNIFNIDSNAIFNMANAITATTLINAGTLAVGNTSQIITGDYTQQTGGTFDIGITNITNYGHLSVTGTVDLSQSGNIYVHLNPNSTLHVGEVFNNVIDGNILIDPANGFTVSDNSFLWKFIATDQSNTAVNLTATLNPAIYSTCQGDYCQGAANTIINQVANGNPTFNSYALLTTQSEFATAASQATPELTNENIQMIQLITQSVMDIVPMWQTLHGKSAGDAMINDPGKVWIKPYGGSMTQNQNNTVQGFDATVYGLVVGKDIQLTEDWLFGAALAFGKDNMRGKSVLDGQTIDSDEYQGMLYAARKLPHNIYFAGQGLIGYGDNSTSRSIPLYTSTADGSYNSWFTNLRAQLGWNAQALPNLILTPELDASYLFVNQASYRESGSAMDLAVDSDNNSSLIIGAYGNAAYHLVTLSNHQDVTLSGYAGVANNILNSQPETTATFIAGGASFSTFGVESDGVVLRSGVGLAMTNPMKPLRISANYDFQKGNNAYSGVGTITVSYKL